MAKHVKGSAIANASSYKLYLKNGTELATQTTNVSTGIDFDLSTISQLAAAGTYELGVKAISGDTTKFLDSLMSNIVSYIVESDVTNYTFTITATPSSALITLTATGYTTVTGIGSAAITVANGTSVSYTVSASGYTTQSGTQSVTSTSSKSITLSASEVGTAIEPIETIAGFYNRSKKITTHGNYKVFKYDVSIANVINLDFKAAQALIGLWEKADGSMLYAYWGDNSSTRSNYTFLVPEYATAFYASAYVGSNGTTPCNLTIGSMESGVILPPISEIDKTYIDATSLENTTAEEACTLFRFNVKDYSNIHLTMTLAENSCAAWVDDSGNRYKIVDGTGAVIDQVFTNADNHPYLEVSPLNASATTMLVIAQ